MKKKLVALALIMALICAVGCTFPKKAGHSKGEPMTLDEESELPAGITITDDDFYVLTNMYGENSYKIAVGKELNDLNFVYEVDGVDIFSLEAEENYAAWVECVVGPYRDEGYDYELYDYKVYNEEKDSVESICKIEATYDEYQNADVGLYKSILYYNEIDFSTNTIFIKSYNLKDKTTQTIYKSDFPEITGVALEVKDGVLVSYIHTGNGNAIYKRDLDTGDEKTIKIPRDVSGIIGVSYDKGNDLYAIYYYDTQCQAIGTFSDGDVNIKDVYTFGANEYAYCDTIKLVDGHLLWVVLKYEKGDPLDRYKLIDYTCADGTHVAYEKTFGFTVDGNRLYTISFEDSIENVKIKIIE